MFAHFFVNCDVPFAQRRDEHVLDVSLEDLPASRFIHHVHQVDEHPDDVQADFFAVGGDEEFEELVEEGGQECDQSGELDGVEGFEDFARLDFGRKGGGLGVQEALGVEEEVEEVLVFGVDGGVEVEADGEDGFLAVDPEDLGAGVLEKKQKNNERILGSVAKFLIKIKENNAKIGKLFGF